MSTQTLKTFVEKYGSYPSHKNHSAEMKIALEKAKIAFPYRNWDSIIRRGDHLHFLKEDESYDLLCSQDDILVKKQDEWTKNWGETCKMYRLHQDLKLDNIMFLPK